MANVKPARRRLLVLAAAVAALVLAGLGGTALAGGLSGSVKSYTGCLATTGGTLSLIAEGDVPQKPCPGSSAPAHFSGGDITSITGGTGVVVTNGSNGDATVSLDTKYGLRQDCGTGKTLKWNGSGWACADDNDTTYTAGTGLALSGTEFSVDPGYRVQNNQGCVGGQFVFGIDESGNLICLDLPKQHRPDAYLATSGYVHVAGTSTIIAKTVPAGKYILFAQVRGTNPDFVDNSAEGNCTLGGSTVNFDLLEDEDNSDNAALTSVIDHPGGAIELKCTETGGDFDVWNAALTAIPVDTIG